MFRGNDTNLAESSMFQPRKAGIGTCAELYVERLNWSDRTPSIPVAARRVTVWTRPRPAHPSRALEPLRWLRHRGSADAGEL